MGTAVSRLYEDHPNLLSESISQFWMQIDGELLLVGFLPGLIFSDASSQNTHLFQVAFGQCLTFAFPMVLAGTLLMALVAYYVLPYDWSFNLALAFGAILSATDRECRLVSCEKSYTDDGLHAHCFIMANIHSAPT